MNKLEKKLEEFAAYLKIIEHYRNVGSLMYWDMSTGMPENAAEGRAETMSFMQMQAHNLSVAKEVHEAGSTVIGVIPGNVEFIKARPQPYVTKLITAENMSERKQQMMELADVFLALPGGIGTLDEISEVITLTKIGVFQKPCILFNRNSFYEPLRTMFTQMEQAGFWWKESMRHVLFSDDLEEISAFIETWDDVK